MNNEFLDLLKRMAQIHAKKAQDYTTDANTNPYENFERAGEIASWFKNASKVDLDFAALIGTKLSRLSSLLSTGRSPNNESIDDTFLDLTTYCALWSSYHAWRKNK